LPRDSALLISCATANASEASPEVSGGCRPAAFPDQIDGAAHFLQQRHAAPRRGAAMFSVVS